MEKLNYGLINPVKLLGESKYSLVYKCKYQNYTCAFNKYKTRDLEECRKNKIVLMINQEISKLKENKNIIQFIGTCFSPEYELLILNEFVFGSSIKDCLKTGKSTELDWEVKGFIAYEISCGIEFLHNNNMVHRNITSSNILLDFDDRFRPKLKDLYCYDILDAISSEYGPNLKLYWKAPEIKNNSFSSGSKKSDIYAFGIVLYELLTDSLFQRDAFYLDEEKLVKLENCPEALISILRRAVSPDPIKRPSAPEITESLIIFKIQGDIPDSDCLTPQTSSFNSKNLLTDFTEGTAAGMQMIGIDLFEKKQYVEAMKSFDTLAWNGDPIAQFYIGKGLLFGYGRTKNTQLAIRWLEMSAMNGHLKALFLLTQMYFYGFGIEKNLKQAVVYLSQMAKKNHTDAMALLAYCYEYGVGVEKHYNLAFDLYTSLAKAENQIALYKLAYFYENGISTKKDLTVSFYYFKKLSSLGNTLGYYALGLIYECGKGARINPSDAFENYQNAAQKGYPPAKLKIAKFYDKGLGVMLDATLALKYYKLAAQRGIKECFHLIGRRMEKGIGTKQDIKEAVYWYTMAAEDKNGLAYNSLGRCYQLGQGVTKDYNKAFSFYIKSAEKGVVQGKLNLGLCYEKGLGIIKDDRMAYHWYSEVYKIEPRNPIALFRLARCYEQGIGVPMDLETSLEFYYKAQQNGFDKASKKVETLRELLDSKLYTMFPEKLELNNQRNSILTNSTLSDNDDVSPVSSVIYVINDHETDLKTSSGSFKSNSFSSPPIPSERRNSKKVNIFQKLKVPFSKYFN